MSQARPVQSLFSQRLDRAVLAVYFLGAVLPIVALGWLVQRYVLPAHPLDSGAAWGWIGAVVGVAVLSLALYFALRRLTRDALATMDADNVRLSKLLSASRVLSSQSHLDAVAERAALCAEDLGEAGASVILLASHPDKAIAPHEGVGATGRELLQTHRDTLARLAEDAIRERRIATLRDAGATAKGPLRAAAAIPLGHPDGVRGAIVVANPRHAGAFGVDALDALETLAALASVALQNQVLQDFQRNFFAHVTDLLVSALDSHVDSREGHARNVARLGHRIAREMGLEEKRLQKLHFASLLHDLGMLKIDRSLHRTPKACRMHTVIGARMLARIRLWEPIAPIVLHHHEWFDGAGYPERKRGEEIPLESRIIALADAVDAMQRSRDDGRPGSTLEQIVEELARCSGTQFDPQVVDAFRGLAERGEIELS